MLEGTDTQRGNPLLFLGGKLLLDGAKWKLNIVVVRATMRFAIATGRLEN
jgi:hypothetical protein